MEEVVWRYEGSKSSDIEVKVDKTGLVTIDQGHGKDVIILLRHELREICRAVYGDDNGNI